MSPTRTSPRRRHQPSPDDTPSKPPPQSPPQVAAAPPRRQRAYEAPDSVMDNPAMLHEDLVGFGYTAEEIDVLKDLPEPEVDNFAQIKNGTYATVKLNREKQLEKFLKKQAARRGAITKKQDGSPPVFGKKGKKTQIVVGKTGSNWVLFDPKRGYPPTVVTPSPPAYDKYIQYKPGNTKIVAYNLESYCIGLRKTPAHFEGHEVQYLKQGPKLVALPTKKRDSIMVD